MNKRQRKKQEKKQHAKILAGLYELPFDEIAFPFSKQTIDVGDTVEIVRNSYGGHEIGLKGLVIKNSGSDDFEVSKRWDMNDDLAMIHHESDLKLIKKGTEL